MTFPKLATLMLGGAAAGLWLAAARLETYPELRTFHHENVLGTSLELKFLAESDEAAARAESAALSEIDRLNAILSSYTPSSEFRRWLDTRGEARAVSPELFEVLDLFDQWRARTGGALDPAAESSIRVWKAAAKRGSVPTRAELDQAVASAREPQWKLDPAARTAERTGSAPLMLNSFVKSYIAGKAADASLRDGARAAVVNIGGDIVVRGPWTERVRVADPFADAENDPAAAVLEIRDRAVASSGNYRRGVELEGRRYSHIVDPRTGVPADAIAGATVVAKDPAEAGALATAFSVMTPDESAKLAASRGGVEYMLIASNGARHFSSGWAALQAKAAPAGDAASSGMRLTIDMELARADSARYRRPYVAVWIEDKDRFPVRTIALWYEKPRWLPDLRAWHRGDRMRALAEGNEIAGTVSSATRPPGKYKLAWDGKDNGGKPVKPGRYTVYIEAAREHGTYQIMRHEMDFGSAPARAELPGNTEIANAVLDYRKN